MKRNVIILGAAGRDFHNFNVFFRDNQAYNVVGFTATQIPDIAGRVYPSKLAGNRYRHGIPIFEEKNLEKLITKFNVDEVFFSYSDISHTDVMHLASRALAAGASFSILGPKDSMLKSSKKVIAVCAVRTGAGKSPVSRKVAMALKKRGIRFVVVRHPMPYGNLEKQIVQRYQTLDDLDKNKCTIEEREDYEPHLKNGIVVYAGVDYGKILQAAQKEAEVIIWDGGNNDLPFFKSDLHIVVADALRPSHELSYHPGEANFRMADIIIVNKVHASEKGAEIGKANTKNINQKATIITGNLQVKSDNKIDINGKKVLIVEDGPTTTHGGMPFGAAFQYAKSQNALIVDPRPYACCDLVKVYNTYPHLSLVLPAVGYSAKQIRELEATINNADAEIIVSGTPTDLSKIIKTKKSLVQVRYDFVEQEGNLEVLIKNFIYSKKRQG